MHEQFVTHCHVLRIQVQCYLGYLTLGGSSRIYTYLRRQPCVILVMLLAPYRSRHLTQHDVHNTNCSA